MLVFLPLQAINPERTNNRKNDSRKATIKGDDALVKL
jgi:hypothetical protein